MAKSPTVPVPPPGSPAVTTANPKSSPKSKKKAPAKLAAPGPVLEPGIARADQPTARPAPQAITPAAVKIHANVLFPHLAQNRDAVTGQPLPPRLRTGGQYSARLVNLVNKFNPDQKRQLGLPIHIDPRNWPIAEYERLSDQETDGKPGNIEVIFDFEADKNAFLKSHGSRGEIDPLKLNDVSPNQFPTGVTLAAPPPGGLPTAGLPTA